MKVILTHDVPKVGKKFDVVDVSDGYANNFLLPQRLAEQASAAKLADLEARKEAARAAEDARLADLREKLATIRGASITISVKADEQGHLFKKLRSHDIRAVLKDEHDITLDESAILLDEPIHEVGDHEVPIEAADETITVTVSVVAE